MGFDGIAREEARRKAQIVSMASLEMYKEPQFPDPKDPTKLRTLAECFPEYFAEEPKPAVKKGRKPKK